MKTTDKYILDEEGNVKPEYDLLEWGRWFENAGSKRFLKQETIGDYWVSTVFLGLDYSFDYSDNHVPILWETMVKKDGKWLDYCNRYATKEEALAGHEKVVQMLKDGENIEE